MKKKNFEFTKKKFPQLFRKFLINFEKKKIISNRLDNPQTITYELTENNYLSIW